MPADRAPRFVDALLDFTPTALVARLLLVSAYLLGAAQKLADWPAALAEQAHFGLHPSMIWAALTVAVELIGSLLVLSGRLVWLGAGMLGIFTVLAAMMANAFWMLPSGVERFAMTNAFFEHLGLAGGFVFVAIASAQAQRSA